MAFRTKIDASECAASKSVNSTGGSIRKNILDYSNTTFQMKAVLLLTVVLLGLQLGSSLVLRDGRQLEARNEELEPLTHQYSCFPWIFNPGKLLSKII